MTNEEHILELIQKSDEIHIEVDKHLKAIAMHGCIKFPLDSKVNILRHVISRSKYLNEEYGSGYKVELE